MVVLRFILFTRRIHIRVKIGDMLSQSAEMSIWCAMGAKKGYIARKQISMCNNVRTERGIQS